MTVIICTSSTKLRWETFSLYKNYMFLLKLTVENIGEIMCFEKSQCRNNSQGNALKLDCFCTFLKKGKTNAQICAKATFCSKVIIVPCKLTLKHNCLKFILCFIFTKLGECNVR